MAWTRDQKIAFWGTIVAAAGLIAALATPEIRSILGLETVWAYDDDGDGYAGANWPTVKSIRRPDKPVPGCRFCPNNGWKAGIPTADCDDSNHRIHPGAPELCDDVDNNCDGKVDENFPTKGLECGVAVGACQAGRNVCNAAGNGVACSTAAASRNDEFHDVVAPNGSWDWNCDGQVEREWGACENLTREQCDPNTNATHASPGFCTQLRAPGGCLPTVAECGQQGWIYPCFYNAADGRCHAGGYETAATMSCR